jgi:hypothetical protein
MSSASRSHWPAPRTRARSRRRACGNRSRSVMIFGQPLETGGPVNETNHLAGGAEGQVMGRESWPRRDVVCHRASQVAPLSRCAGRVSGPRNGSFQRPGFVTLSLSQGHGDRHSHTQPRMRQSYTRGHVVRVLRAAFAAVPQPADQWFGASAGDSLRPERFGPGHRAWSPAAPPAIHTIATGQPWCRTPYEAARLLQEDGLRMRLQPRRSYRNAEP